MGEAFTRPIPFKNRHWTARFLSLHWPILRKGHVAICNPRRESSPDTDLDLELLVSRTVRNKYLLLKTPSLQYLVMTA